MPCDWQSNKGYTGLIESLQSAEGVKTVFFGIIEGSGSELLLDPTSWDLDSVSPGQDLRFSISNMLPGNAAAADFQATRDLGAWGMSWI